MWGRRKLRKEKENFKNLRISIYINFNSGYVYIHNFCFNWTEFIPIDKSEYVVFTRTLKVIGLM